MLRYAASDTDIIVTGRVPDIRPYLKNSDCMLVALEFGGGTRLKILEAFAAGCPVVSTPKGAEGIAAISGTHLMIATTDSEIVESAVEICLDRYIAKALIDNARGLIASTYDWPIIHRQIEQAVQRLALVENSRTAADSEIPSLRR
jgi:glycosyltransferase involved in cell wall biosynthesis